MPADGVPSRRPSPLKALKRSAVVLEIAGFLKGTSFRGTEFYCPCCRWGLRRFTSTAAGWSRSSDGYCPRCFSKARHRRAWMEIESCVELGGRILHVAPRWAILRRLRKLPGIDLVAIDVEPGLRGVEEADLSTRRFPESSFDGVVCIHVLEHIDDDSAALDELTRMVAAGGWLLLSVPLMLDRPTYEDPSIVDPQARRKAFGEPDHRRVYGVDLVERVASRGFDVTLLRADDLDDQLVRRNGLRLDEHLLACRRTFSP